MRNLVLLIFVGSTLAECPNDWVRFDSSCYLFSHMKFDFFDAEQFCNQQGGYLTHIETAAENTFIRSHCRDLHAARRWIGLTDQVIEGRWVWHGTDQPAYYTDWQSGEPNQHETANCGNLWEDQDYHWADDPCGWVLEPICEKPDPFTCIELRR